MLAWLAYVKVGVPSFVRERRKPPGWEEMSTAQECVPRILISSNSWITKPSFTPPGRLCHFSSVTLVCPHIQDGLGQQEPSLCWWTGWTPSSWSGPHSWLGSASTGVWPWDAAQWQSTTEPTSADAAEDTTESYSWRTEQHWWSSWSVLGESKKGRKGNSGLGKNPLWDTTVYWSDPCEIVIDSNAIHPINGLSTFINGQTKSEHMLSPNSL